MIFLRLVGLRNVNAVYTCSHQHSVGMSISFNGLEYLGQLFILLLATSASMGLYKIL